MPSNRLPRHKTADPWSRSINKLIHRSETKGARKIGLTGTQVGIGVSMLARRLAQSYADLGKSTLLIASCIPDSPETGSEGTALAPADLLALARRENNLLVLELASDATRLGDLPQAIRRLLDDLPEGLVAVVDLPPVVVEQSANRAAIDIATACGAVYLVCLSGITRRAELTDCVETSRLCGLEFAGIIANDWKLVCSQLLAGE